MNDGKASVVLNGFINLTPEQKQQFIIQFNAYLEASNDEKEKLKENFKKRADLTIGPHGAGGCPCCGL